MGPILRRGVRAANYRLATTGGRSVTLRNFAGHPVLFVGWASWHASREKLAAVEAFHLKHRDRIQVASIAFDVQGLEFPMRYYAAARGTHTPLIDATCVLSRTWGLKEIPFWAILDADGCVQAAGTTFEPKAIEAAMKKRSTHARRRAPKASASYPFEFTVQQCGIFLSRARREDAVRSLEEAAKLDPENRLIRPQALAIMHPEKFYAGPIDEDWVRSRLGEARP
ncbi:MAG: TlpA family protein disulfide reductase [Planctomycetes bacterium]|nr:TlpA family protein disulfide reductase [Planctomycetota bacterium]